MQFRYDLNILLKAYVYVFYFRDRYDIHDAINFFALN